MKQLTEQEKKEYEQKAVSILEKYGGTSCSGRMVHVFLDEFKKTEVSNRRKQKDLIVNYVIRNYGSQLDKYYEENPNITKAIE